MEMRDILATFAFKFDGELPPLLASLDAKVQVSEREFENFKDHCKFNYVTIIDDNYPDMLKHIQNPPIVLFYKGNLSLLNPDNQIIARASDEGVRFFHAVDPDFTPKGISVDYVMACECHDDMDMLLDKMNDVLQTLNMCMEFKKQRERDSNEIVH